MTSILEKQLEQLKSNGTHILLKGAMHGIEKEGLRVDSSGTLSLKPHPDGLGSALTNSNITTDFSESLLELITPVYSDPESAIQFLEDLHRFTYSHLDDELIWAGSMPCHIPDPEQIPIARYGSSNIGKIKYIYRLGLMHRYGKMMQSIAGIHYNFSLSDDFWLELQSSQANTQSLQEYRSASYFKMIRNFRRHSWLLHFLFGASPALCETFLDGKQHKLQRLHDHTLYLPYATSLRMSDLGYSTKVQGSLGICFNHLSTYIDSLIQALQTSYPPYEEIGVKINGEYRQLNDTILQIENEYYSDIRPKRVANASERPIQALKKGGVEYIEIRNVDVNPFLPVGIDIQQALFLDIFLISCLLMDEHDLCQNECRMVSENFQKVITRGREPGLLINTLAGECTMTDVAYKLLNQMSHTGELLDEVYGSKAYTISVSAQLEKLSDASQTPSAQVLQVLKDTGLNYTQWILQKSKEHKKSLMHLPSNSKNAKQLEQSAIASLKEQQSLEANDAQDFDQFLAHYLAL